MYESVFRIDENGKAEAYRDVKEDEHREIKSVMDACPVAAIKWSDGIS